MGPIKTGESLIIRGLKMGAEQEGQAKDPYRAHNFGCVVSGAGCEFA